MNNYNDRGKGGFNKHKGGGDRGHGGGRPSFGGDKRGGSKFGGSRDNKPTEMFSATCATCQKSCQVPFRPSNDKPVYCSDCFSKKSDAGGRDSRNEGRPNDRQQKDRFPARREHSNDRSQDSGHEIRKRLSDIEAKLNKILDLINPPTAPQNKTVQVLEKKQKKEIVKKEVDKGELKKVVEKAVAVKVEKKPVAKKPAKKVAKKVVKKVVKKAVKKVAKKVAKKK